MISSDPEVSYADLPCKDIRTYHKILFWGHNEEIPPKAEPETK